MERFGCVFAEILTKRPLLKEEQRSERHQSDLSKLIIPDRVLNEFFYVFVLCRLNFKKMYKLFGSPDEEFWEKNMLHSQTKMFRQQDMNVVSGKL